MQQNEHFRILALAALSLLIYMSPARSSENTGRVQQLMVNAEPVLGRAQETLGLVTLRTPSSSCSATLLDNVWAITAAHCVADLIGTGLLGLPAGVTLTANWDSSTGPQVRNVERIVSYQPLDVAILRATQPFRIRGSERVTFKLDGAIGEQHLGGYTIEMYGRGIVQWARGSGSSAMPTVGDGQYRVGAAVYSRAEHNLNWFNSTSTGAIAGGDSGGPSFIITQRGRLLAGVHALCHVTCVSGKSCNDGSWMWVSSTTGCADAPVLPVWQQIRDTMKSPAAPSWDRMSVKRHERAVDYLKPTIQVDNDFYRLDVCREWGANCGKPAADAFCAANEDTYQEATKFKLEENFGHTAVISNGQLCFGSECDTFASITCGSSKLSVLDRATDPGPLAGQRGRQPDLVVKEDGGIAGVLKRQSTNCKSGYVWRVSRAEDLVCVPPESRARTAEENRLAAQRRDANGAYGPNTCRAGYVWREAFKGDVVCVPPAVRAQVHEENRLGPSRRASE